MSYVYPRAHVVMTVPVFGTTRAKAEQERGLNTVQVDVVPRSVTIVSNDHNTADEAEFEFDLHTNGIDPRLLKNAGVSIYMADAGPSGLLELNRSTRRFVGVVTRVRRKAGEGSGSTIDITCQDYTRLFLDTKPLQSSGIPDYNDTLETAWQKICDHVGWPEIDADGSLTGKIVSVVEVLRNRLEPSPGVDIHRTLGTVVSDRFRKQGHFSTGQASSDAWGLWNIVCTQLSLVSFIHKDKCIVRTSSDHFQSNVRKAPRLVYGKNIYSMEESANTQFEHKGVVATSFDALTGTVMEAAYPPFGDARVQTKRVTAATPKAAANNVVRAPNYEYLECNWCNSQEALDEIAKRAYEERSRQEITGVIKTSEAFVDNSDSSDVVDLMDLTAGDSIRIDLNLSDKDKEDINRYTSQSDKVKFLIDRGYSEDIANLIIANIKSLDRLSPIFHISSARTTLSTDEDSGEFSTEISYHNRILVTGGDDDQEQQAEFGLQ